MIDRQIIWAQTLVIVALIVLLAGVLFVGPVERSDQRLAAETMATTAPPTATIDAGIERAAKRLQTAATARAAGPLPTITPTQ